MSTVEGNNAKRSAAAAEPALDSSKSRSPVPEQGPGNVDKIRDILFGSQMRDYEVRFARLEESLRKESSDLRESTKKRLDALEGYIKKELESLESRLKSEKQERTESHGAVSADLKSTAASLTKKISDVENQNGQAQRELRKELLEQSNKLSEEIRAKNEELASVLDRRVQELRNDKTDRAALANLLTEVAMRLTDEFRVPGAE
jgi:seryl-tRNA synthetase